MAAGDGLEGGGQVGEGLDAVQPAGADEGGEAGPGPAALVMACEECVLPVVRPAVGEPQRVAALAPVTGQAVVAGIAVDMQHARREIIRATPKAGSPVADDLLGRIAELYKIEAEIRGAPADIRLTERRARSKPILKALRAALDLHAARLSKKSEMGKALAYILARWDGLTRFAEDGRIEMDTNPVENAIRPLALSRKNALFAGHDEGGRTWARLASLIGTCRLNSAEPLAYLSATLEAIAHGHPAADIDALMPWAFSTTSTKGAA